MASNKFLDNLSAIETDLNSKIFDLVIGRVFKKTYSNLDKKGKENIKKVFLLSDKKEKERIIKKHMPNFKILFKKEAEKIEKEIRVEIKKQF